MHFGRFQVLFFITLFIGQTWLVTTVDALTQRHYWNTERQQYEHAPMKAVKVFWDGSLSDAVEANADAWTADPCPVPDLMHRCSSSPNGETGPCSDTDIRTSLAVSPWQKEPGRDVFQFAPKHSPPMV